MENTKKSKNMNEMSKGKKIAEEYLKGKSFEDLSKKYFSTNCEIARILQEEGVPLKNTVEKKDFLDIEKLYTNNFSIYAIAGKYSVPSITIKNVLISVGVLPPDRDNTISTKVKPKKPKKLPVERKFILSFQNQEKIRFLKKKLIALRGANPEVIKIINSDYCCEYFHYFYNDEVFNRLFEVWKRCNEDKYLKPSLDYIIPISRWTKEGSPHVLSNLRYCTWLENRARSNILIEEWNLIKENIHLYFD